MLACAVVLTTNLSQGDAILDYPVDELTRQPKLNNVVFCTNLADTDLLVNPSKFKFIIERTKVCAAVFFIVVDACTSCTQPSRLRVKKLWSNGSEPSTK